MTPLAPRTSSPTDLPGIVASILLSTAVGALARFFNSTVSFAGLLEELRTRA